MDDEQEKKLGPRRNLHLHDLPDGCIADILHRTSPRDVGQLMLVSRQLKLAAESDLVWEHFLPPDYNVLVPELLCHGSKKELYLRLSSEPLLIDHGTKSFWLDKWSGKKCFMLSSMTLKIGGREKNWTSINLPESRFSEVAMLDNICWLEIHGRISTTLLSSMTHYKAYLIFKKTTRAFGLGVPTVVIVAFPEGQIGTQSVYLEPDEWRRCPYTTPGHDHSNLLCILQGMHASPSRRDNTENKVPTARGDTWYEIELCDFFNEGGDGGQLGLSILEIDGLYRKGGLIVEGMEFRSVN